MSHSRIPVLLLFAAVTLSTAPALSQTSQGRIAGTVRDANGAPVVGATITIATQQGTTARAMRTTAAGTYEATGLTPGIYAVTADMPGFRRVTKPVNLTVGTLTVDFDLEVRVAEEVTVTAMKREETVQNTPVSVAAPTAETLRARGAETLEDVAANVADFSVQNLGPGQNQPTIRGISSGQIVRDQPGVKESVGVYLDESVISLSLFTPDIDLFDMNRVEVLRGPQGTLFGSGSEGGTVRYISNGPELNVRRYFAEFEGSTLQGGNQGGSAKVGVNVPVSSTAAVRIAGYYDRLAGWTDAVQPDLSVKSNVNTGDRTGVRASLELAPNDQLTVTPRFFYQYVKTNGWNREDAFNILANPYTTTRPAVKFGDNQYFAQFDEPYTDKFALGDLNVRYNFGEVALTSITSYTHRDILVVRDATSLTASITGGSIGLPEKVYTLNAPLNDATKAQGWTEELRFSGGKERFKWVGGGFYADLRREYGQNLPVTGFEALTGIPTKGVFAPKDDLFFSALNYKLRQFAFFGEGTYSFNEKFDLTGGLRYYNYKEDKSQVFDGLFGADENGNPQSQPGTVKADGVAPRFIASYKATPDTTLNAQVSKGFRLGGVNDPLNVTLCTPSDLVTFGGRQNWKDEVTWNYEIGAKSRVLAGRGTFNLSAFYEDIRDLQVTVTAGSCSSRLIFNVPRARSVGAEAEFAAAVTNSFDFAISASYDDATLRSTVTSTDASGAVSVVSGIQSGARLPSIPKFQGALSATYQQPISPGLQGYATATYTHVGARFTEVGDNLLGTLNLLSFGKNTIGAPLTQTTFTYNAELPAYDIVNARIGTRFSNFDVALYVNNVTNEHARLAFDRERGTRARIFFLTNQPRTYGISTRVDF